MSARAASPIRPGPRNGRRPPSIASEKAEKPTPASPILRRNSRFEMRRLAKSVAVSTMNVCLSCFLKLMALLRLFVAFQARPRVLLLERSQGQAANQLLLHQQDEDEARHDG